MFRNPSTLFFVCVAALVTVGCGGTTPSGADAPGGGGSFTCGTVMCTTATQYCEESRATATGMIVTAFSCQAIPTSCTGTDFCTSPCFTGMTGFAGCGVSNFGSGSEYRVEIMR